MKRVQVDPKLVEEARKHRMTHEERSLQAASFAMGAAGSKISRERIKDILEGRDEPDGSSKR